MSVSPITTYYCWKSADETSVCYTEKATVDVNDTLYMIGTGYELPTPTIERVTDVQGGYFTGSDLFDYYPSFDDSIVMANAYYAWYNEEYDILVYTLSPTPVVGDAMYINHNDVVIYTKDTVSSIEGNIIFNDTEYTIVCGDGHVRQSSSDIHYITTIEVEEIAIQDTVYTIRDSKAQTDIAGLKSSKQDTLIAGNNITIDENNVISATGGSSSGVAKFAINSGSENLLATGGNYLGFDVSAEKPLVFTNVLGDTYTTTNIPVCNIGNSQYANGVYKIMLSIDDEGNVTGTPYSINENPVYVGDEEPGYVGNFSNTNYITVTDSFSPQTSFDIILKLKTGSSVSSQVLMIGGDSSLVIALLNGKIVAAGYDAPASNVVFFQSTTTLTTHTNYFVRFQYNSTTGYSLSIGDTLDNLVEEGASSTTTPIMQNRSLVIGANIFIQDDSVNPFYGEIDLKSTSVSVDDNVIMAPKPYFWLDTKGLGSFKYYNGTWIDYSANKVLLLDSELEIYNNNIIGSTLKQPTYNYNGMSKNDNVVVSDMCSVFSTDIMLSQDVSIYYKDIYDDVIFSFNTENLGSLFKNKVISFELYLNMSPVCAITFPSNITWIDEPDLSSAGKYLFAFRSFDGGITWLGNLEVQWS